MSYELRDNDIGSKELTVITDCKKSYTYNCLKEEHVALVEERSEIRDLLIEAVKYDKVQGYRVSLKLYKYLAKKYHITKDSLNATDTEYSGIYKDTEFSINVFDPSFLGKDIEMVDIWLWVDERKSENPIEYKLDKIWKHNRWKKGLAQLLDPNCASGFQDERRVAAASLIIWG